MKQATAFMTGAGTVAVLAVGLQVGIGLLNPTTGATANSASSNSSTGSTSDTSSVAASSATPSVTPSAAPSASASATTKASASASSSSSSSSKSSSGITGTFHGQDVPDDAGYGDVQVDVTFKNGKITDVTFVSANATHGRAQAFPMLRQETLDAQSSNISNISGATFTSDAYMRSIQSAFDAAGFKG